MKKDYGPNLKVFVNKGDAGFPNERKFILESKWWRKWCDYTGFEAIDNEVNLNSDKEFNNLRS